jgi:hypothetical protein
MTKPMDILPTCCPPLPWLTGSGIQALLKNCRLTAYSSIKIELGMRWQKNDPSATDQI